MLLKLSKTKIRKESGFSLVELSMVLAISGMLFSSGLIAYQSLLSSSQAKASQENIDAVYKAIGNYLITNRKLPCPASLTVPESDPTYGSSIGSDGDCSGSGVTIGTAPNNSNYLAYGMVPTKTLNLPNFMAKDGFNTKLSYIVDRRFTALVDSAGTTGFEGMDPNANMIQIQELSSSVILPNAIMVIVSHGINKFGGFNANGTSINSTTGASTDENNNIVTNFNNIFVTNSLDTGFDDILLFKDKLRLAIDSGFENMMCRGTAASYLLELPPITPSTGYGTARCYDNSNPISLTWDSANYGESNIPQGNTPCPAGCAKSSNPIDYDNNVTTNHPLRRCDKYGIWSKVIYPCYFSTAP